MKKLAIGLVLCLGLSAFSFSGPLGPNEAYIIRNEAALWQEQSGGVLKWAENLTIGDQVTLLNRTAKFKLEGAEREFIKVKALDGMEGWVRTLYVAPKASLGVIKADGAIVYSEPRDVKITSKSISSMTIVAMLQEGSTSSFAKVMCYDAIADRDAS